MRAVWLKEFGAPEVLVPGEAPDPVPDQGQVLIEVKFANITFIETQFRATGAGPFAAELALLLHGPRIVGVVPQLRQPLADDRVLVQAGTSDLEPRAHRAELRPADERGLGRRVGIGSGTARVDTTGVGRPRRGCAGQRLTDAEPDPLVIVTDMR